MYLNDSEKSKGKSIKSPLSLETFELIQSGEASKALVQEYLAKLENFLANPKSLDHSDFFEANRQLDLVAQIFEELSAEEESDKAKNDCQE